MQITVLLQLIVAHICTDFLFQTKKLVDNKNKFGINSPHLYLHSFLGGFLSLLFSNQWEYWYVGLFISVTHFFIDWWKISTKKDNLTYFVIDQVAHLVVIVIAWLWIQQEFESIWKQTKNATTSVTFLITLIGYLIVISPVGFLIDKATKKWQEEISENNDLENGLVRAGRYIGVLERVLVLTFVILNQVSAIGFLIAAKSILRYGDKDKVGARKQAEYVLVGTLMSFTFAIAVGLLVRVIGFQ